MFGNKKIESITTHSGIYKFELPYLTDNLVPRENGIVPVYNCDIEIHVGNQKDLDNGFLATVIISANSDGVGNTNFVEDIATMVLNNYIDKKSIRAEHTTLYDKIRWIERNHYPKERFDLVNFEWHKEEARYIDPDWYKLAEDDWILENHRLQPYK
ncbi:hypothetical protein [Ornithinibacillus contaminans]|uniref:hypothetical protein n=1 Tax=Ornithinibacillus contaminans TaxID=694055 RepID=UPI00064DE79C|nr:hypothetical protein [Ornithinibacillus contaminans]